MKKIIYKNNPIKLLNQLLTGFKNPSIFLFGAGTSSLYLPPSYNLISKWLPELEKDLISIGVPIDNKNKELSQIELSRFTIQGGDFIIHQTNSDMFLINETEYNLVSIILKKHPEILELICMLEYSIDTCIEVCPEYGIFNFSNKKSLFLNMNHDNLAERFIHQPNKISLHGTISQETRKHISSYIKEIIEIELIRGHEIKKFTSGLYLSAIEDETFLINNNEYSLLFNYLEYTYEYIFIIGYSFFKKNDCQVYDKFTFDILRQYLLCNPQCNIVLIDKNPEFISDIFSNCISLKNITLHEICWSCFARSSFSIKNYILSKKFLKNSELNFLKKAMNKLIIYPGFYHFSKSELELLKRFYNSMHWNHLYKM